MIVTVGRRCGEFCQLKRIALGSGLTHLREGAHEFFIKKILTSSTLNFDGHVVALTLTSLVHFTGPGLLSNVFLSCSIIQRRVVFTVRWRCVG